MDCEDDGVIRGFKNNSLIPKRSGFFDQFVVAQDNFLEPTLANGDCLFASFLQAIGINQLHVQQLRQVVYESLRVNTNLIINYFHQDNYLQYLSPNTYLELIRQPGFWGGYPELQLLSLLSGININIRSQNGASTRIFREDQPINTLIPEISLYFSRDHYTPVANYAVGEYDPNDSVTFQRILANQNKTFDVQLLPNDFPPITLQQEQQQLSLVQDQAFLDYIRENIGGNLDRVLYQIISVGGSNLEEYFYNLRNQEEQQEQPEDFDFTPVIFQQDFMFKQNNIYKIPHCQEHDFGQIQGSNILNEAYMYLNHLSQVGIRLYPDSWNKGATSKERSRNRNKKLKKINKYYVQQCGKEHCKTLALYQKDVRKGKEVKDCRILTMNERKEMTKLVHKNHEKAPQMAKHLWNMGAYWYGMETDCKQYIESCEVCVQEYTKQQKRQPGEFQDPIAPNHRLVIDCVEIAHNVAKQYIQNINKNSKVQVLTIIDAFSKKANAFHLSDKRGSTIKRFLDQHFTSGIIPKQVLSDNGTEFINQEVIQLMNSLGIEYIHGRPYHPQTQGVIERFNQTFQQFLYRRASQDELNEDNVLSFQEVVNQTVQSYNNRTHSSHGLTPNEAYMIADENKQKEIVEYMKSRYPKQKQNYSLKKGDKILVLDDVQLAKGRKNLLVRQKIKSKGKRVNTKAKYSLMAVVTDDSEFNVRAKFEPGQKFDPESYFIIPTEFVKKVNQNVFKKMTKEEQSEKQEQDEEQLLNNLFQQRQLKPCIICYESDNLRYTQCCNQPIHVQCYFNGLNHNDLCPFCRMPNYKIQDICLFPDRKYLDNLDDTSDDIIDLSQDTEQQTQVQPQSKLAEIREEIQEQEDLNFPVQEHESSEQYDYGEHDYNISSTNSYCNNNSVQD